MDISININLQGNLSDGHSTPDEIREVVEACAALSRILERRASPAKAPLPFLAIPLVQAPQTSTPIVAPRYDSPSDPKPTFAPAPVPFMPGSPSQTASEPLAGSQGRTP